MLFEISEYYTGGKIRLKPRGELYDTRDYMGKQMPGLAIVLDEVDQNENVTEQYAVLTVSFGDFLTMKNCAFIDTNNCPFAPQLLSDKIAQDTGSTACCLPVRTRSTDCWPNIRRSIPIRLRHR